MDHETLLRFKELFEDQRNQLVFSHSVLNDSFDIQNEDLADDLDLSTTERDRSMRLRLRNRETLYLKKIDQALMRIREGEFGLCMDCGDEIQMKRLWARPTTTLCVSCKEHEERRETKHIDSSRSKSLGRSLRLASG